MVKGALRKIEADLLKLAADSDPIDHDAIRIAALRIGAQAEMLERGLGDD